jgi:hypothetical protein
MVIDKIIFITMKNQFVKLFVLACLAFVSCNENNSPAASTTPAPAIPQVASTPQPVKEKQADSINPKLFRIEIHQRGMTFDENFIFSNDSIYGIGKLENGKRVDTIFTNRKISAAESNKITNTLATFAPNAAVYDIRKPVGDNVYYFFTIHYDAKKMNINMNFNLERNSNLVQLCDSLNTLLPEKYQIRYKRF